MKKTVIEIENHKTIITFEKNFKVRSISVFEVEKISVDYRLKLEKRFTKASRALKLDSSEKAEAWKYFYGLCWNPGSILDFILQA